MYRYMQYENCITVSVGAYRYDCLARCRLYIISCCNSRLSVRRGTFSIVDRFNSSSLNNKLIHYLL